MKSRFGFVSNSSSSSFVLPVDYYGDISEVSKGMLDVVIEDYEDWSGIKNGNKKHSRLHSTWIKNLNKALKKKSVKSGKIGIVMSSCNYDTYIIKRDDKLYISTSSNHDWNFFDGAINYEYVSPDDNNAVANELESIIEGEMFFDIRDETTHSNEKWCDSNESKMTCPTCKKTVFGYVVNKNGKKICNNCRKGDLGKTPEKEIEKLLENRKKNQNITSHMSLEE